MPVNINELDSSIAVEPPPDQAEQGGTEDSAEALARLAEQTRQLMQREARTAAWGFDD
jgi:hypothetical protein